MTFLGSKELTKNLKVDGNCEELRPQAMLEFAEGARGSDRYLRHFVNICAKVAANVTIGKGG